MEALCLIPPMVVIILGIVLRRAFEPLLIGCLVGFLLIDWRAFPANFVEALRSTLEHRDMVWIILVCGLYGSLIHLLIQSGSVFSFGQWALQFVKSRRSALVTTWLVGLFIFIDDYMSALASGVTMRKITDRFRVPRETLAFLVTAMAAPVCLIIPMSTWSIYVGKLLEDNKIVAEKGGFDGYLAALPYMFYPWVIVIMALLLAMGRLPLTARLRAAEARVAAGGPLAGVTSQAHSEPIPDPEQNTHPIFFFLPLFVLIGATLYLDKDALLGVMAGLAFTFFLYWGAGLMRFSTITDGIFEGIKSMVFALAILTMSYVLKTVGDKMGLTPYVIASVTPYLSKAVLAAVVFVTLAAISYTTASSWGMYAVALPIVVPLAQSMGANVWLAVAAVVSAGGFGSQASFYSDVTVLTATSTECDNVELSMSQLPYNLTAAAIAALLFLVVGFM
jgi:tetracycline resistance efflux pump